VKICFIVQCWLAALWVVVGGFVYLPSFLLFCLGFLFFRPWFWFWFGLAFCVGLIGWVGLGWFGSSELRIVGWWS
jgi:hypothetical protein